MYSPSHDDVLHHELTGGFHALSETLSIFKIQCQLVVPQNFLLNSSKLDTELALTLTAFFISLSLSFLDKLSQVNETLIISRNTRHFFSFS